MCFYVGNDIYYLRELEDDLSNSRGREAKSSLSWGMRNNDFIGTMRSTSGPRPLRSLNFLARKTKQG
ncbi:unnamed protein product [Tenebrio molitor]|nr:unnamed protein product [Tenebrio molitor]